MALIKTEKKYKSKPKGKPKLTVNWKNCSYIGADNCAVLEYTTHHSSDNLPSYPPGNHQLAGRETLPSEIVGNILTHSGQWTIFCTILLHRNTRRHRKPLKPRINKLNPHNTQDHVCLSSSTCWSRGVAEGGAWGGAGRTRRHLLGGGKLAKIVIW